MIISLIILVGGMVIGFVAGLINGILKGTLGSYFSTGLMPGIGSIGFCRIASDGLCVKYKNG